MGNVLTRVVVALVAGVTSLFAQPVTQPLRIDVSTAAAAEHAGLETQIQQIRRQADAFVFLSGGASNMQPEEQRRLLSMFAAIGDLPRQGRRIAVGDGGTQAGIMQAAGDARRASGGAFPLIGIAPARELPPRGKTPSDPNHSLIVAVDDLSLPVDRDGWGSETATMYDIFARLADGRPSVTVVANGGGITLNEVEANVKAGRTMILIEGSGRAADALVSLLRKTTPADEQVRSLRERAQAAGLVVRPELYRIVAVSAGAAGLRAVLERELFAGR